MSGEWLEIQGLDKSFDGIRALQDFSCSLREGEILGLIGPNGAGKTTLFNVLSGFLAPDGGNAVFRGMPLLGLPPYRIARAGMVRTFPVRAKTFVPGEFSVPIERNHSEPFSTIGGTQA